MLSLDKELDTTSLSVWQARQQAEPTNLAITDTYVLLLRQSAGAQASQESIAEVLASLPPKYKRKAKAPEPVTTEELDFAVATVLSYLARDFGLQLDSLAPSGAKGSALPKLESAIKNLLEIRNALEAQAI